MGDKFYPPFFIHYLDYKKEISQIQHDENNTKIFLVLYLKVISFKEHIKFKYQSNQHQYDANIFGSLRIQRICHCN